MKKKQQELTQAYLYLEGELIEINYFGVLIHGIYIGVEGKYLAIQDGKYVNSGLPAPATLNITRIYSVKKVTT